MKVAINGFGRIGRILFRLLEEDDIFDIVAINDLSDSQELAYLLKYDSIHGTYKEKTITYEDDYLICNERKIKVLNEKDPLSLPWRALGVELVFECTGKFTEYEEAYKHIDAGCKKVLISAPGKGEMKTIVYNVNENELDGTEEIISCGSCTTNCLAPVLKVLDDNFKVVQGFMTTIHAYTNDQNLLDAPHKKGIYERRARAGAFNIVPTSTGAAKAIGNVLPNLKGKLDGMAMRVPVTDGSAIDVVVELEKQVTKEDIARAFFDNRNETMMINFDPIVSSDIIGTKYGALIDGSLIKVQENDSKQLIKVIAWYDNEVGYSMQMIRLASFINKK